MYGQTWLIVSCTISLHISGVSRFVLSVSPSPFIAYMIDGLHVSGKVNLFVPLVALPLTGQDEEVDAAS